MMFNKVLVANRGEIAIRVIRACQELGVKTVAIYSEVDSTSKHVQRADEAYCVGKASALESYMNVPKILEVAKKAQVDAIHPGYGFLAEDINFAAACEKEGFVFIGPRIPIMELMSSKVAARETAKRLGVPVVQGTDNAVRSKKEAVRAARKIGYPILVKPSGGGGGRGLRIANNEYELMESLVLSEREANMAFVDTGVFLERYIEKARHLEVQIMADNYGHVVHLGERDCTVQRRHQKLIEESPSPVLEERQRRQMLDAALKLASGIGYNNAGTVEFVLDDYGNFYFIEMNTRIQVEHTVTEMVTGIDLVKEQISVAAGGQLSFSQEEVQPRGWALQCRINAEDPEHDFMPSPGVITYYERPAGGFVRIDDYAYSGYELPFFYDSLMGKVVTWGRNRTEAIERMKRALSRFRIEGVKTTIPFHLIVLNHPAFISGQYYTDFVQELASEWIILPDAASE